MLQDVCLGADHSFQVPRPNQRLVQMQVSLSVDTGVAIVAAEGDKPIEHFLRNAVIAHQRHVTRDCLLIPEGADLRGANQTWLAIGVVG